MKKLLTLILFACLALPAFGQLGNVTVIIFPGAPTGACQQTQVAINLTNQHFYTCPAGAWFDIGPGSAGSAAWSTLTPGTNSAAGSFIASGNTWDFTASTFLLPHTAVTPGSYTAPNITVGADGRITAASNGSGGGGTPGGTPGQIQYNNAGAFGGFTATGDCTITPSTGAVVCTKTNGTLFSSLATTTPGTGIATWLGTPSSANLRAAITDETGTGLAYFQNGNAGTPSAINLTNGTALPIAGINATGTPSSSNFLRGDGTWNTPAGGVTPAGSQFDLQTNGGSGALGAVATHSALTGQSIVANNAAAPTANSPGFPTGNGGAQVAANYTVKCDSSTAILDRAHNVDLASGITTLTVPDGSDAGCGSNFFFTVTNGSGGTVAVNRETSYTFTVFKETGGAPSTAQTTFNLLNGQTAKIWNGAGTVYDAVIAGVTATATIASGTSTMGTSAISSGTCATVVTTTATGVAATDAIILSPNTDPTAVTGYGPSASGSLYIQGWPTSGHVNFKVCNNTSGSITPSALTLNWRVVR